MAYCCGKKIEVDVPKGPYDYKTIEVKCGNTSPYGTPYQCEKCEEKNRNVNWRQEAAENGEGW